MRISQLISTYKIHFMFIQCLDRICVTIFRWYILLMFYLSQLCCGTPYIHHKDHAVPPQMQKWNTASEYLRHVRSKLWEWSYMMLLFNTQHPETFQRKICLEPWFRMIQVVMRSYADAFKFGTANWSGAFKLKLQFGGKTSKKAEEQSSSCSTSQKKSLSPQRCKSRHKKPGHLAWRRIAFQPLSLRVAREWFGFQSNAFCAHIFSRCLLACLWHASNDYLNLVCDVNPLMFYVLHVSGEVAARSRREKGNSKVFQRKWMEMDGKRQAGVPFLSQGRALALKPWLRANNGISAELFWWHINT